VAFGWWTGQVTVSIEDGELAVEGLPDGVVVERSRGGPGRAIGDNLVKIRLSHEGAAGKEGVGPYRWGP